MMLTGDDEGCWFESLVDLKIPLKLSLRGDLDVDSCWGGPLW